MHIFFNMFALISFGSALEHFGEQKVLFSIFLVDWERALIHSGVNYYHFQWFKYAFHNISISDKF